MIDRGPHPELECPEAEIAVGSLTRIPPADIARHVVIAEDQNGNLRFATPLTNWETACFLTEVLTGLLEAIGIPE